MKRLGTVLGAAMVAVAWSAGAAAQTASAQDATRTPVIVTSGEAEVKRPADRAWVTVVAESRAKDPKEAQRLNTEAMGAVLEKLKGLNLGEDAVRTTGVELHPEFDYHEGKQTLRGYLARNSVEVRVDDVTRVGEVLTAAVGSGATSVGGLRFDLKEREAAEQEALTRAVANARARAQAAASGAGLTIERILRIEDHRASAPEPPRPVMMMRQSMEGAAAADVPVTPGSITLRAAVSLTVAVR